jgi:3'-phosphoadenosine 5'-phosphosulfate sulfotransferase (PAPS reductase)/FAD synthetase
VEACNFPGKLDETAVKRHLTDYCRALGIERKIVRSGANWRNNTDLLWVDTWLPILHWTEDQVWSDIKAREPDCHHGASPERIEPNP